MIYLYTRRYNQIETKSAFLSDRIKELSSGIKKGWSTNELTTFMEQTKRPNPLENHTFLEAHD